MTDEELARLRTIAQAASAHMSDWKRSYSYDAQSVALYIGEVTPAVTLALIAEVERLRGELKAALADLESTRMDLFSADADLEQFR